LYNFKLSKPRKVHQKKETSPSNELVLSLFLNRKKPLKIGLPCLDVRNGMEIDLQKSQQ
jgi:hypothetical protein